MADPRPPGDFSADLEKWVVRQCRSSVFFVMATPKEGAIEDLEAKMEYANVLEKSKRKDELSKNRATTGFVVQDGEDNLKILTCAHLIDHVFKGRKPISAEDANNLFLFRVLCDHAEMYYTSVRGRRRAYSIATVLDINCRKDMLLLEIAKDKLYRSVSAIGNTTVCTSPHQHIPSALNPPYPEAMDKCMMISWPSEKHLTTVGGRVSHLSRTINAMPGKNENGYSVELLQADMRSEKGASGSALLSAEAHFIGMLHGGDVQFSYFVSVNEISAFLARNGVERVV